ncbi:AtzA [Azoarcus sp. CIB]|uniref:hypothetical protein n=1 Tax=Aromatoleum sp. (strain CIB) TaxID=198107 RepID=UPI0006A281ED|nr:hypothetical protein [Azoarcus sp. CIB]AKU10458.1 AtzA [Azoarcus sp. CIB]
MTYLFARIWLNSSWSERVWTWINATLGRGQDPGFASDVELVIVLVCAAALASVLTWVAMRLSSFILPGNSN